MNIDRIIEKAINGNPLSAIELDSLLAVEDEEERELIFSAARQIRAKYFGNKVFLYGFVYFSTYCSNHCSFCYYRQTNQESPRYRKTSDETVAIASQLVKSGVHLIDLTMGEDPFILRSNPELLVELVKKVTEETNVPVMISPGLVKDKLLVELFKAGATWYACYQETHSPLLFRDLRIKQSYHARMKKKALAKQIGMLVEDGILLGVGETKTDIRDSLMAMMELGASQTRVMSFIPQNNTPLAHYKTPSRDLEMLVIAIMRIFFQDKLIPASLDIDGISGLEQRLKAGANVITSIIPPSTGLAGVSQWDLDIDQGNRTVFQVKQVLTKLGMQGASLDEYWQWIICQQDKCKRRRDSYVSDR
ncbi:MAG: methylornithine synthase PylB [Clostridia bacterium]|jgi:methylornithine synthase|nr:methylornithine synthase PylB [Clostridia bacterium]